MTKYIKIPFFSKVTVTLMVLQPLPAECHLGPFPLAMKEAQKTKFIIFDQEFKSKQN